MDYPTQSDREALQAYVPTRQLPEHLIALGEPIAGIDRVADLTGLERRSVHAGLTRLRRDGRLFSPARGLYVAVPPEYRSWGVVPAEWFADAMMRHLRRRYYVALLTAASMLGAAAQAPQVFQVMVDRQLADRDIGRVRLRFHVNRLLRVHPDALPTETRTTHTGAITVASPELTAVDLATNPDLGGGLSNVATVLTELPRLDEERLSRVAALYPTVAARRLGWLLETFGAYEPLEILRAVAAPERGQPLALEGRVPRRGPRDLRWGLVLNTEVEPDLGVSEAT
jgi:predicted transcriptional regulator of viral defense system